MQGRHGLSGFDLIESEGQGEAASQLLNTADMGGGSVQIGTLILYEFVEELKRHGGSKHRHFRNGPQQTKTETCRFVYLLQAEDESFGTLDLVRLSGLAQGFLDDVTVVVVVLKTRLEKNRSGESVVCGLSLNRDVFETASARTFI